MASIKSVVIRESKGVHNLNVLAKVCQLHYTPVMAVDRIQRLRDQIFLCRTVPVGNRWGRMRLGRWGVIGRGRLVAVGEGCEPCGVVKHAPENLQHQ